MRRRAVVVGKVGVEPGEMGAEDLCGLRRGWNDGRVERGARGIGADRDPSERRIEIAGFSARGPCVDPGGRRRGGFGVEDCERVVGGRTGGVDGVRSGGVSRDRRRNGYGRSRRDVLGWLRLCLNERALNRVRGHGDG